MNATRAGKVLLVKRKVIRIILVRIKLNLYPNIIIVKVDISPLVVCLMSFIFKSPVILGI